MEDKKAASDLKGGRAKHVKEREKGRANNEREGGQAVNSEVKSRQEIEWDNKSWLREGERDRGRQRARRRENAGRGHNNYPLFTGTF